MDANHNEVQVERRKYVRLDSRDVLKCKRFSMEDFLPGKTAGSIEAVAKNYNAGGLLFESSVLFNVGELLKIELAIPGWERYKSEFYKDGPTPEDGPLVVLATVVRVEIVDPDSKFDIGVSFSAIDAGHRNALLKFINSMILKNG